MLCRIKLTFRIFASFFIYPINEKLKSIGEQLKFKKNHNLLSLKNYP